MTTLEYLAIWKQNMNKSYESRLLQSTVYCQSSIWGAALICKHIQCEHKVSCLYLQDYGETPLYLQQRNEAERRAQEENDRFIREQREQGAMHHLSDEERQDVLQVFKHMQCLS